MGYHQYIPILVVYKFSKNQFANIPVLTLYFALLKKY